MRFKNLLITGGAGFIGSHFADLMLNFYSSVSVTVLDNLTYAADLNNISNAKSDVRYNFIKGDINNSSLVESILDKYSIDCIVHFAAESHVDNSILNPGIFLQTNVMGTHNLLATAARCWSNKSMVLFHHVSTDEVYGSLSLNDAPFLESTPYKPNSPYSASKAASDHLVRAYHNTYNLPVTISNCSNNYGARQNKEKLIPTIINACLQNKPIPIYGDGKNIRDWLYVKDHCHGIRLILEKGKIGSTYNIGGGVELTNIEITHAICNILNQLKPGGKPFEKNIQFVKDRAGHDFRYAINCDKISEELGYLPQNDFILNLEETVKAYL